MEGGMDRETINWRPSEGACIAFLEEARWGTGRAQCPHWGARKASPMPAESRYHCNGCGISFSVTTRCFMHRARVERRQWLVGGHVATERDRVSARALAPAHFGVRPNTYRVMRVEGPNARTPPADWHATLARAIAERIRELGELRAAVEQVG